MLRPIIGILAVLLISGSLARAGSQGSVYVPRVPLFAICASIGFLLHWIVFIPSFIFQTEHYFDAIGSFTFVSLSFFLIFTVRDFYAFLICSLVAIWSLRLGSFLFLSLIHI